MASQFGFSQLTQASSSSRATAAGGGSSASIVRRLDGISHIIPPCPSAVIPSEFILHSTYKAPDASSSTTDRSRSRETATPAPSGPTTSVFRTPTKRDRDSRSQSVTPQKRRAGAQEEDLWGSEGLGTWTVRVVQRLLGADGQADGHQALYERHWEGEELSELAVKQELASWSVLAGAVVAALLPDGSQGADSGPAVDVQWSKRHQRQDGTCERIKLAIHLSSKDGKDVTSELGIKLDRVSTERELATTSEMVHELVLMNARLRAEATRMHQEQVKNRKLMHNGRKHELAKEANSSLANPGRIKRQTEDTEGFEGDD